MIWFNNGEDSEEVRENLEDALREFVYLDQISVNSLLASLDGAIKQEQAKQNAESDESHKSGAVNASVSGVGFKIGGEDINLNEESTEIVKKYASQSLFTELYDHDRVQPSIDSVVHEKKPDWNLSGEDLDRGKIIRADISLSTHYIYKFYKMAQYISNTVPNAIDTDEKQALELLGSLFGEYIPVIGIMENFKIEDGNITPAEHSEIDKSDQIRLVGTLKKENLWQEESQSLFDNEVYSIYCRVETSTVSGRWYPLNLTQVVNSVSPQMARTINQMMDEASDAMRGELNEFDEQKEPTQSATILDEWEEVFGFYDENIDIVDVEKGKRKEAVLDIIPRHDAWLPASSSRTDIKDILVEYNRFLVDNYRIVIPPEREAEIRESVYSRYINNNVSGSNTTTQSSDEYGRTIEVDVIALHW